MIFNSVNKIKKYYIDEEYVIDFFAVITGQKCTLKCRYCANFSPYYPKKFNFYNMDKIIKDIENVTKRIKHIKKLHIQGGDFFLHKDALKLLQYVSQNNKIKKCQVATNCILIPKEEVLEILKNPKFLIRISSYENINEIKKENLEQVLIKKGIKYRFYQYANRNNKWSYLGGIDTQRHSEEETLHNYQNCVFKRCLTLENGLISRCARATVAHNLQKYRTKKSDFVNVRNKFFAINELKKFISRELTGGGYSNSLLLLQRDFRGFYPRRRTVNK